MQGIMESSPNKEAFQMRTTKLQFQIESKYKSDLDVINARGHTMFLDDKNVIISGKVGELYLLPLSKIEAVTTLPLKYLSADLGDDIPYIVAERNEHYKQLYSIIKFYNPETKKNIVMTLGIDRRLSFWNYILEEGMIDFIKLWDISFLGGKVLKILTNE
jgi:hypothetical protein